MQDQSRTTKYKKVSLHNYIMERSLLIDIIDQCASRGNWDFIKHGLINNLDKYNFYGYSFQGFFEIINSIPNYFKSNLDLLNYQNMGQLFLEQEIYTKSKDQPPTKLTPDSNFKNSLAANGCIVKGKVQSSLLFRGVRISKGAQVKNCIIMQEAEIGRNARVENAILDKNSQITAGKRIRGGKSRPTIIEKNEVV